MELADAESGAECTPRTRFQIASVSKQFAAWIPDYAASLVIFANEETANPEKLLKQLLTAADKA